ncbi:MAG TPA: hypothetical protein VHI99_29910 [Vicinamibacterales bacterium]|jgi:hypothetical protein|nr:hypothetical protein [Vicinamibacterales bacterium]
MADDLLHDLGERISALVGDWTKYTVVGSFLLYVAGYLALRFHLTAIGIGTDLAVLDERYLFTGARFLVYLVSAVPNILLVALPIVGLGWLAERMLPEQVHARVREALLHPRWLTIAGIVVAVLVIQLVMRQCFAFSDLLLAHELPRDPAWLVKLLVDDTLMPIYFSALVAACAVSIGILIIARRAGSNGPSKSAWALLAFLAAVEVLLLPVNYGVLIVDKALPRVAAVGEKPMTDGSEAWLVWEGKDAATYLVRDRNQVRSLLTLRGEIKQTEIVGFDRILPKLFGNR